MSPQPLWRLIKLKQPHSNSTPDQLRSMPLPVQTTGLEHDDQASGFETSSAISINTGSGAKQIPFDPLQEFYAEAREASENKVSEVKSISIVGY